MDRLQAEILLGKSERNLEELIKEISEAGVRHSDMTNAVARAKESVFWLRQFKSHIKE